MMQTLSKGGPGSGNPGHGGRPGHVGGSAPQDVPTSAQITTEAQAVAYWRKHFADGRKHALRCKYGKRTYRFNVRFERNHAYTEDTRGTGRDKDRTFSLDRARGMDNIMTVLQSPDAVTWSRRKPGNKQFDKLMSLQIGAYGKVILGITYYGYYGDTLPFPPISSRYYGDTLPFPPISSGQK